MTKSDQLTKALDTLFDQLQVIKDAGEDELDFEAKKAASLVQTMAPIISVVEAEVKLVIGTGIVPQNSIMVTGIKDIVEKKPNNRGLLVDEFIRK